MKNKTTKNEPVGLEDLRASFAQIVKVNGYRKGTNEFKTAEYSFLQGVLVSDPRQMQSPYIVLCLMAGRSILGD